MKKLQKITLILVVLISLTSCVAGRRVSNRIENPATVYCKDSGGESFESENNERICILKNGTVKKEWDYFSENYKN